MEQKVASFIGENNLICAGEKVGVATSGGVDSMALLVLLRDLGYPATALHFEHGIRGEASRADAAFVREFCAREGIPFLMKSADVPAYARDRKMSMEAAGRELRYAFLLDAGLDRVATAHHMDDNAESVLLNIARGCGVNGLTGIGVKSGVLVRPFLCVRRAEIEEYAGRKNIPFVTDQTNFDMRYARNRIRHGVLKEMQKVNPSAVDALCRLAQNAREYARLIGSLADKVLLEPAQGGLSVSAALLGGLEEPVAAEVLLRMCDAAGSRADVSRKHIEAMLGLCRTGAEIPIKNGIFAKYNYGRLIIYKKSDRIKDISFCVPLGRVTAFPGGTIRREKGALDTHNQDKNCECFGRLPDGAVVRTRRPGDVFAPFGSGEKKLKEYLIDQKIPQEERDALPLVAEGSRIIWVVGVAISADYAVEKTGECIRLKYSKEQPS